MFFRTFFILLNGCVLKAALNRLIYRGYCKLRLGLEVVNFFKVETEFFDLGQEFRNVLYRIPL
jgi:hypothetical protein